MSTTFNPDAPTPNGGWLQHTYQPQQNDTFFWGGSFNNPSPFGMNGGYNDGSRRNAPINPVNPFGGSPATNPFNTFGQTQANGIPESAVQPFSSYPPSTPSATNPNMNMGLNGLVESRRNVPLPTQPQNNPWAPQQPAAPQFTPQMPTNPINWNPNPFDPYACQGPGFSVDMNTAALYNSSGSQFGFDKRNAWENCYTSYRPIQTPGANWNTPPQQYSGNCYPQYQNAAVQYPNMAQIPTSQQSWKDIAVKNWDMVK